MLTRARGRSVAAGLAVALGIAGSLPAAALAAAQAPPAAPVPLRVSVDRATLGTPRSQNFLGLALELRTIPQWVGGASTAQTVNPVLVQLMRNLTPSGEMSLRIGGQSTDRSWWPVPGVAQPPGVTYAIGPQWAAQAKLLAAALPAKLILSVNLEADSPQISGYEAAQMLAAIGRPDISDFEIGNEPDLYTTTPWYWVLNGQELPWYDRTGTPFFSRPAGYDAADYLSDFQRTLKVMPPSVPIAGPDAVSANWIGPFSDFVRPGGRIGLLDSHSYALLNCVKDPLSPRFPTIPNLLALGAANRMLNGSRSYISVAHENGITFRIDEMGSVSCDGKTGVSDTMASALWATDALFVAARAGVDGVNLHSYPGSTNGLFDFNEGAAGWTGSVHPIYYGALMFARADPAGARLLSLTSTAPSTVRVWATIGVDHRVRVLIDNVGAATTVLIHAPRGFGARPGAVQRLRAPSVAATDGLSLGGRAFGETTSTGRLGSPRPQTIAPGNGGYAVSAPAGSETLLTLSYRHGAG